MTQIEHLIPDEVTIKIISPTNETLTIAPPHLRKSYWVQLGEAGNYEQSFDSLEQALQFITREALAVRAQSGTQDDG